MIVANGNIETKIKSGGGINPETGYPNKPSEAWGEPIPCQYQANNNSLKGRTNGEAFRIASYEILIDEQPYESEQLRLSDDNGKVIGEFSVIDIKPLAAVCQVKILV